MRRSIRRPTSLAIGAILALGTAGTANSGLVSDYVRKVGGGVVTIVNPGTAALLKIKDGTSLKDVPREMERDVRQGRKTLGKSAEKRVAELTKAHAEFQGSINKTVYDNLGSGGLDAYLNVTTFERMKTNQALTYTAAATRAVQGRVRWDEFYSLQLATLLRQAYQDNIKRARRLNGIEKRCLAAFLDAKALARVRVVEGQSIVLNIAEIANLQGGLESHAITIDNLIVFSTRFDLTDSGDRLWVGHELMHVAQYRDWGGIDQFARKYLANPSGVERAADSQAIRIHRESSDALCSIRGL
jgi:hypothetical protein